MLHAVSYRSFDYLKFIDTRIVRKTPDSFLKNKKHVYNDTIVVKHINTNDQSVAAYSQVYDRLEIIQFYFRKQMSSWQNATFVDWSELATAAGGPATTVDNTVPVSKGITLARCNNSHLSELATRGLVRQQRLKHSSSLKRYHFGEVQQPPSVRTCH